jgi:hypothetical protein
MDNRLVNRWIALHFVWTILIAVTFFRVGDLPFQMVLLVNAGSAATIAAGRRESLKLRRLTLWDEAVGFVGVSTAAGLLQ